MRRITSITIFLILILTAGDARPATIEDKDHAKSSGIQWEGWSEDLFERAKRENRFVLLDLEAVWCHWCHVMEKTTYKDPAVMALINSRYIAVRVDQDSRPDLSNRYEDYGWPATIVFNSNGEEIIKRSGYIPPKEMVSVLKAIIKDPTPGPSVTPEKKISFSSEASLPARLRRSMISRYYKNYDYKNGGWGFIHKFLDWDSVEYSMVLAREGNAKSERMARQTLKAQRALLDPVWGGVYQYSTGGNWKEPHFEKIMSMQAENLRIYSLAYQQWGDPVYLETAESIHRYLKSFLSSPEGAFYTSQDADLVKGEHSEDYFALNDAERRKLGVPKVDTHIYARENGWVINALVALYSASGDEEYLNDARRAALWIIDNRSLPGGGFRHDNVDAAGPYLGDTLSMGRAFLSLYSVTGERQWLGRAEEAAKFISLNFKGDAGFATSLLKRNIAANLLPRPQRDENMMTARFTNMLFHYSGKQEYRTLGEHAMRFLSTPEIARRGPAAGVLLAETELSSDPVHITVVGSKNDPNAQALFRAALKYPSVYKRVEYWDRSEGPLPNQDVEYPELKSAAAFACSDKRCSLPALKPEDVQVRVERLYAKPQPQVKTGDKAVSKIKGVSKKSSH